LHSAYVQGGPKTLARYRIVIKSYYSISTELDFSVKLKQQSRTVTLSPGIKYSMHCVISGVSYSLLGTKLRYMSYNVNGVSVPPFIILFL